LKLLGFRRPPTRGPQGRVGGVLRSMRVPPSWPESACRRSWPTRMAST
jgi:hypothetical protein